MAHVNRVCFVTGTRAEFGLMRSTLLAIQAHPRLKLTIVATGMHLDPARGHGLDAIRADGWRVDRVVSWGPREGATRAGSARCTGSAMTGIAAALEQVESDIVLVVGDRVEAFAAAAAGHISGRVVAHVHGGDRATGQVDDALRHAITKLAHIHFPATKFSAERLLKLGEDRWRIKRVGSPGIDGIARAAAPRRDIAATIGPLDWRRYALLLLHPVDADEDLERRRAHRVARAVSAVPFPQVVVIYPNNDPGSAGIVRAWQQLAREGTRFVIRPDVPRRIFLGLLREAALLVGNSSSGIIEAASFGTPVIDVGPRQKGREHGGNVVHVPYAGSALKRAISHTWHAAKPRRAAGTNVYGASGAGRKIAATLAGLKIDERLMRKLIAY